MIAWSFNQLQIVAIESLSEERWLKSFAVEKFAAFAYQNELRRCILKGEV